MLRFRTAPCPILTQDKRDNDKEERKGQTWPVFSDNVAEQGTEGNHGVSSFVLLGF